MVRLHLLLLSLLLFPGCFLPASAQKSGDDDDVWRKVTLGEVDFAKKRNYCVRLFGYFRYTDDGVAYMSDREHKLYRVTEGICAIDVRYKKNTDDGMTLIEGRNLVHPDKKVHPSGFFEITPYTFLEKARRDPKHFTLYRRGNTLQVNSRRGQVGTVVTDTLRGRLTMDYNALAPDTAQTFNLLALKGRLSNVKARATYRIDDGDARYVPQGNLMRVVFTGDVELGARMGVHADAKFNEVFEFYVDSVAYMTRDAYKADKKRPARSGYTRRDIDRLKAKYGVAPLSRKQLARIEEQREWDEMAEQWSEARKKR